MTWMIGCLNFEEEGEVDVKLTAPGTWGAFNSLLSSSSEKTNVALVPPLIRSPPTDYDTLYTGLMRAHNITTRVMGSEAITVMTLDLQLYDLAMKLWVEREDIRKQFLFRPALVKRFMSNTKQQKPTLTGQRFKTRKRDEKEKFEPSLFRDAIVQGLEEAGEDLEAASRFLDVSSSKLDYRRYADTLFDILVAGGMLGEKCFPALILKFKSMCVM
uniref:uncharacterized protein isoform X1 n=2 Tax=Myxine glutinosa TaxID=7769 RepID=UPI00358E6967